MSCQEALLFLACASALPGQQPDPRARIFAAYKAQQFAEADRLLAAELGKHAGDASLWTMRGMVWLEMDRAVESLTAFDRALKLNPAFPAARQKKTEACTVLGVREFRLHRYGEAASYFEAILRLDAANLDARFNAALSYHEAGQHGKASAVLAPLLAAPRPDSRTLRLLADIEDNLGRVDESVNTLVRAVSLDPLDETNYLDLARLCLDRERAETAIEVLNHGIELAPKSSRLLAVRALALTQAGRDVEAAKDFDRAALLDPSLQAPKAGAAAVFLDRGQYQEAAVEFAKLATDNPADAGLQYSHARALLGMQSLDEAKSALLRTIALDPDHAPAITELGRLSMNAGKMEEAIRYFSRALKAKEQYRPATYLLMRALRQAGREAEAAAVQRSLQRQLSQGNLLH